MAPDGYKKLLLTILDLFLSPQKKESPITGLLIVCFYFAKKHTENQNYNR